MQKVLFLFLMCYATIYAEADFSKIFKKAIQIAEDESLQQEYRDSAAALSDIWSLSRNYTYDLFLNEEIEWSEVSSTLQGGDAVLLENEEIMFFLGVDGTTLRNCFLSLREFRIHCIEMSSIKILRTVRLKNLSKRKIVNVTFLPLGFEFSDTNGNKKCKVSATIPNTKSSFIQKETIGLFSVISFASVEFSAGNKKFKGKVEKGEAFIFIESNKSPETEINGVLEISEPPHEVPIYAIILEIIKF